VGEQLHEIWRAVVGFTLLVCTAIGWWIKRQIGRLDSQEDRIEELEKDHVTRQEMKDMQYHIDSSIKSSEERLANRIDRIYDKIK